MQVDTRKPYLFSPHTLPVHLTATVNLPSSSSAGVNSISLKNPMGRPMEILEIKFELSYQTGTNSFLGSLIGCKLNLGKLPLTNGFVPTALFGRAENSNLEVQGAAGTTNPTIVNTYTWRLAKPFYVPSDSLLVPEFVHRGLIQNAIDVRVSYSGRTLLTNEKPKKVYVPLATSWLSRTFDLALAGTDQSTETDLVNPWEEVLHLQRISGRVPQLQLADQIILESPHIGYYQAVNVRMVDSFGRRIIQPFMPFADAFPLANKSWEADGAVMDPKSYMIAYIRKDTPITSVSEQSTEIQERIGLVGYRELGETP